MLDKFNFGAGLNNYARLLVLISFAFLGGCASSVVVKPDIPSPLVQKLAINTGLVYTDTFKGYVYLETEKKRSNLKSIDFTAAQTVMFEQVFGALTNLVDVDDASRTLSIEPEILDFQYTAPAETKLKQYEIWIKYRLKLRDANDNRIADWTIKGYGKTPTGLLTSASSAFSAATNVALRDVGAQLSTRFARQRVVKTLLEGGTPRPIPEPEPETEPEKKIELAANVTSSEDDAIAEAPSFEKQSNEGQGVDVDGTDNGLDESQADSDLGNESDKEVNDET